MNEHCVFLSYAFGDLRDEAELVAEALSGAGFVISSLGPLEGTAETTWRTIEEAIAGSHSFVLLLRHSAGSLFPGSTISWVEKELDTAHALGKDIHIFASAPGFDDAGTQLRRLRARIAQIAVPLRWNDASLLPGLVLNRLKQVASGS